MTERVTGVTQAEYESDVWYLNQARAFNGQLAVRCVESHGVVTDFVACPEIDPDMWIGIRHDPHTDDTSDGWITETPAVRNCIQLCDPDVELIEEPESLFAEERNNVEM